MKHSRKLFEKLENTTVDKALDWFLGQRENILGLSEKDAVRSAAFYAAFKRLTDEFVETVKHSEFPRMTDGLWGYDIDFDQTTVELILAKYYEDYHFVDGKEIPIYSRECSYSLVRVEAKLLGIDEYARHYGVDPKTVTQWIRRGKLRTAKKIGNVWMIPEVADTPARGYSPALYILSKDIRPLTEDYPFLIGCDHVYIVQDEEDKKQYHINCYIKYDGTKKAASPVYSGILSQKEKEKFELALITHPGAKYIPDFGETIIPDIMRADSKDNEPTIKLLMKSNSRLTK